MFCQIAEIGFIFTNPLVFCGKCDIILYIEEQSRCQRVQVPEIRGVDSGRKHFVAVLPSHPAVTMRKTGLPMQQRRSVFCCFFIFPRRKAFSWCDCVSVTRRCFFYDKNQNILLRLTTTAVMIAMSIVLGRLLGFPPTGTYRIELGFLPIAVIAMLYDRYGRVWLTGYRILSARGYLRVSIPYHAL